MKDITSFMLIALAMTAFLFPACAQGHTTLVAGDEHTMHIDDALTVWGWGGNNYGQLSQVCSSFLITHKFCYRMNAPSLPSCYRCLVDTYGM
jgi:alpha-tubulin suppressor-like RCC1 family protein